MGDNDFDDYMARLEAGKEAGPKTEMTRGQQTAWIVGTLVVLALAGFVIWANQPPANERDPECYNFLGFKDTSCKAEKASQRLWRRF